MDENYVGRKVGRYCKDTHHLEGPLFYPIYIHLYIYLFRAGDKHFARPIKEEKDLGWKKEILGLVTEVITYLLGILVR